MNDCFTAPLLDVFQIFLQQPRPLLIKVLY